MVNGQLTKGFAFVAYPAEYRNSGVVTFIVNQDGVVYEKDLGADTEKIASTMTEYNPDSSWSPFRLALVDVLQNISFSRRTLWFAD